METKKLDSEKLTGPQKAAIFFLTMGEEFTAKCFKELDEKSIKKIGKQMSKITYVPSDVSNTVMDEFLTSFENDLNLVVSGKTFLKQVVNKSLDKEAAKQVFKVIDNQSRPTPFNDLANVSAENMINIIQGEHPQTIALILSYLPQDKAAEILAQFSEEQKADIAYRILKMGQVDVEIVNALDETIKRDLSKVEQAERKYDGVETLANILNAVDGSTEEFIMSHIEEKDSDLANLIKEKMFVFEDLLQIEDKQFRDLLQNVDNQILVKALRTSSEEMKNKIFSNLSERASEMLKEDMEVLGPIKLKDVEEAQQEIIRMVKQLEAEGRIVLSKGKDDVFV
jgi:flagellar motor switch protein FliG